MKISACMIAKNEEQSITRCIDSYKGIVDEIIVVDTGSVDNTIAIAKSLGAKVYHFEWINDFSKAKNFALSKAKGDWIIFLDADEYFDKQMARNIPKLIKKYGRGKTEILACKMYNIDEVTGNNLADFAQTRIFKNTGRIHYANAIHERLSSKNRHINAVYIEENELVIYHTGYSEDRIISKAERNLELLLLELEKPVIDPSMYHFLSDTYLTLKEYEKSIEYAKKFLDNRVKLEGLNNKVYQNLITAMVEKKYEWSEIYSVIEEAIAEFPDHPMFQMYLARANHFTKRYDEALKCYLKAIELQEKYNGIEINFITGKIHEIETPMASIFADMNKEETAVEFYIKALKRKKDYIPALQGLIKLIGSLDAIETIATFNRLYDRNNREDLSILLEELTKLRSGKLLPYYVNHMNKQFGHQDFSMVIMLLSSKKYEESYKYFFEAYLINYDNNYAKLAIVSALLNNDEQALMEMRLIVKPSLKRIIEALKPVDNIGLLYKEDFKDYLDVLGELLKLEEDVYIDRMIALKENFCESIVGIETVIGNILKDKGYYEKAIEQFKAALEISSADEEFQKEQKSLYFIVGYCYYKIRNMNQALKYFDEALINSYLENDTHDFLLWIVEQTEASETKLVAKKLLDRFYTMKLEKTEDKSRSNTWI